MDGLGGVPIFGIMLPILGAEFPGGAPILDAELPLGGCIEIEGGGAHADDEVEPDAHTKPFWHCEQEEAPAALYWFSGHFVQELEPSETDVPAGH